VIQTRIKHSKPQVNEVDLKGMHNQLISGNLAGGETLVEFESKASAYMGFDFAYATNSGSGALLLILEALNVGVGDEVIIPVYACSSLSRVVRLCGALPVYCDSSKNWCSTSEDIAKHVTKNTKAIVLVHLYGIDASSREIYDMGIPVIDDFCQAFGLQPRYLNPYRLSFASFAATKCLTTGEGGMVFSDKELVIGSVPSFAHEVQGISDLAARLGITQLEKYDKGLKKRKEITKFYLEEFKDTSLNLSRIKEVFSLSDDLRDTSIFFRFVVTTQVNIDRVISDFRDNYSIDIRKGVDHLLKTDQSLFPSAIDDFRTTISIPLYPALSDLEIARIVDSVKEYFHA
jgi:perosamine synthetase